MGNARTIGLPNYAEVVHADFPPDGRPCMEFWTEVWCDSEGEAKGPLQPRAFRVFRTDESIPDTGWHHVASARAPSGSMFHLCARRS
jgi:hypothetical protein